MIGWDVIYVKTNFDLSQNGETVASSFLLYFEKKTFYRKRIWIF